MELKMVTKSDFYECFRKIPKAELHLHIEAVISFDSVKKLYLKKNPNISEADAKKEIDKIFEYSDLNGFIQAYLKVQDFYESVDDFDLIFEDLKNYLVRNGIVYAEVFSAPSAFIKKGFDFGEMTKNYQKNIRKIKEETGIEIKMLIDVSRTFGPENAEQNLSLVLNNRIPEVIGIGLGGSESKGPCKEFGEVFEKARENGLCTVAHAGEDCDAYSIWDAVNILKVSRVGHGITAIQDEKLMDTLVEKKVALEVCPTSNIFTKKYVKKLSEHPIRNFFDKGICVTINTDDPLFFRAELLDEYWNAYSKIGFKKSELKQIIKNSFLASFLSDEDKSKFIEKVDIAWNQK